MSLNFKAPGYSGVRCPGTALNPLPSIPARGRDEFDIAAKAAPTATEIGASKSLIGTVLAKTRRNARSDPL